MVRDPGIDLSIPEKSIPASQKSTRESKNNAATGASAASIRALGARMVQLYFRVPVKAFFRTRVDYLAFARAINPRIQAKEAWSFKMSTPGLLAYAVRTHGWGFLPNQVLPPLLANVAVGTVLFTSYQQTLGALHAPSSESAKRVYPPPPPTATFAAGLAAGAIQSIIAAPLDALQTRFQMNEMLTGRYKNMWQYGYAKLKGMGPRSVFAGWGLSLCKDTLGHGAFFAAFEFVKAQVFYSFVTNCYGQIHPQTTSLGRGPDVQGGVPTIRPHYACEPAFLLLGGISASIAQQIVQYPLGLVQDIHYGRFEALDLQAKAGGPRSEMMRYYREAYRKTFALCSAHARRVGGWRKWIYRGFFTNTLKQIPSTSAGLVIFELVRRRYANEAEAVRIKKNGYDILLT